jgi:hypothetical protein
MHPVLELRLCGGTTTRHDPLNWHLLPDDGHQAPGARMFSVYRTGIGKRKQNAAPPPSASL